ncbi:hypothetical protein M569_09390, partial [Genlisea aurea]
AGKTTGVCISKGGRFPPFTVDGKPPKKSRKGPGDLSVCRIFRRRTCCDSTQTHPVFLSVRTLASSGEATQDCLHLWELLECSICDPSVGVTPGPPRICASFCHRVFEACSTAYFSTDPTKQASPCRGSDFVCGRASEWVANGTELCHIAGFSVDNEDRLSCYGGKASLDHIATSWKSSSEGSLPAEEEEEEEEEEASILRVIAEWVGDRNERVSWAVGGMVLTAGVIFSRKRKSRHRRHRERAIQHTVRRLTG